MARQAVKFKAIDQKDERHKLEVRPEARGWSIWIDGKQRYHNQTFDTSELFTRFAFIRRGWNVEPVGKAPKWFFFDPDESTTTKKERVA